MLAITYYSGGGTPPVIICELRHYLPSLQFYWAIHSYNVPSVGLD